MVQRKVVNKLGIQADQVKYNKLLVSLKPSSFQHQDNKNRGADMKKKIKKSRSIKHSDIECLSTPCLKNQVPQPGKPPPTAASPEKKSIGKASESTPNYMKSTSSFDARKEQSQVSSRNLLPLFDSKSSSKRNSNSSETASASSHKPARILARPSSLKLVRTLTKTISFKPARASANKCSPLALSENLNVQRATCSSTLKDSKFPAYLTLDSGGSEAEGTSAMKVCPYTYCSLNGHHHPRLPPLKSFLSARRCMLKSPRSIKLGCLSPRRSKANKEAIDEREKGKANFDDNSSTAEASNWSVITPMIQQEHDDFFIHIYSKERETVANTSAPGKSEVDDLFPSTAPTNYHACDSQVTESLLEKFPLSEIGCHENCNENGDVETSEYYPEKNQDSEEEDEVYPHFLADEDSGDEKGSTASILVDDAELGNSAMEWQGGRHSTFYLDGEADNSFKTSQDYDFTGDSVEYDNFIVHDGSILKSEGTVNSCFEGIQASEIQVKSFDEESMSSNAGFHPDFEIDEHVQGSCNQSYAQLELITMDESNEDIKKIDLGEFTVDFSQNPLENPIMEACADLEAKAKKYSNIVKVNSQVEDASIQTEVDAFTDHCENQFLQDDTDEQTCHLDYQDKNAHRSTEECSQNDVNLYQSNACIANCLNFQASSGNTPQKKENSESETNRTKINAGVGVKEKDQCGPSTANITIEIIITLQDSCEAAKMKSSKEAEDNHIGAMEKDGKSDQTVADIDLSSGTQDNTSNEKFVSDSTENLSALEENKDVNHKSCKSTDFADQPHSPATELSLADHTEQDLQKTEMKTTSSLGEETCPAIKSTSNSQAQDDFMEKEDNSDEELSNTCKKLKWTNKSKTSTEEQEGPREFNPRAPNFLPVEPEEEAEKVDLRHQMIDDRRNSEEWMIDYALQQAVHKLAPARKKKVAVLVEAFEKVMPIPNFDTQMRHASVGFVQSPRPIQACS